MKRGSEGEGLNGVLETDQVHCCSGAARRPSGNDVDLGATTGVVDQGNPQTW